MSKTTLITKTDSERKRSQASLWKPGDSFKAITGKTVAECKTVEDIDAAVAFALKKKSLTFGPNVSSAGFVVRNGDVFPHSADTAESIAKRIAHAFKGGRY